MAEGRCNRDDRWGRIPGLSLGACLVAPHFHGKPERPREKSDVISRVCIYVYLRHPGVVQPQREGCYYAQITNASEKTRQSLSFADWHLVLHCSESVGDKA